MNTSKTIEALSNYKSFLIQDEIRHYNKEYLESKWYKEPTLKEIVGETLARDFEDFEKALNENPENLESYLTRFDQEATEYGKSWFDEDLDAMRTGYEFEMEFYATLRNMVANLLGVAEKPSTHYWEGIRS